MCSVCGCGAGETRIENAGGRHAHAHDHHHTHADGVSHAHGHEHGHEHNVHDDHHLGDDHVHHHHDHRHGEGAITYGQGHAHVPGLSRARTVAIEQEILSKNNAYAADNRAHLNAQGILALNLVSSPGSGKTTLLVKTIECLAAELAVAVVEGDQETSNDAARIRATGVPAIQVNTGKGCHLDAHMVGHAIEHLSPAADSVLFIENVGNLVCPAAFDLGEAHKVVILSVTEGEDKPLKYPDMFHAADLMIIAKIDLLPHVDFSVAETISNARKVNPRIKVLQLSARTGEGLEAWCQWIKAARAMSGVGRPPAHSVVQGS